MSTANLKRVLEGLGSDRSTKRHESLKALRIELENEHVLHLVDSEDHGAGWSQIYHAIFRMIIDEQRLLKNPKSKKEKEPTAAAVAKAKVPVDFLRTLLDRSCEKINPKTYKSLLLHILTLEGLPEVIYDSVVQDYIHIFNTAVLYRPHREHIDISLWVELTTVMFAILLDEPLDTPLLDDVQDEEQVEQLVSGIDQSDNSDQSDATTSKARKRSRSTQPPGRPVYKKQKLQPTGPTLSPHQISSAAALLHLFHPTIAVLTHDDHPLIGRAILNKFRRFFETYPNIGMAHYDMAKALLTVLMGLELNAIADVAKFGRRTWPYLMSLWNAKDRGLKVTLTLIFTILLPFVGQETLVSQHLPYEDAKKLYSTLEAEVDILARNGALPPESLSLRVLDKSDLAGPFSYRTFQLNRQSPQAEFQYWTLLELCTDCAGLDILKNKSPGTSHPLLALTSAAQLTTLPTNVRVSKLQRLLFFTERHTAVADASVCQKIINDLVLINTVDQLLQSWVLICLAGLVQMAEQYTESLDWQSSWRLAFRGIANPSLCRESCHLGHLLLIKHHTRLPEAIVVADIEIFLKDISVQGPSYPYDSVSSFIFQALRIASGHVQLYRLDLEEKVVAWLGEQWKQDRSTKRGGTDSFRTKYGGLLDVHPEDVLRALLSGKPIPAFPAFYCPPLPEDDDLHWVQTERWKNTIVRDFLLHAQVPLSALRPVADTNKKKPTFQPSVNWKEGSALQRIASVIVQKQLDACLSMFEQSDEVAVTVNAEMLKFCIDVAIVAIFFLGIFSRHGWKESPQIEETTCKLLRAFLTRLCASDAGFTIVETVSVLQRLLPLLGTTTEADNVSWHGFIKPTVKSGIRYDALKEVLSRAAQNDSSSFMELTRVAWRNPEINKNFLQFKPKFMSLLKALVVNKFQDVDRQRTVDDFAIDKTSNATSVAEAPQRRALISILVKLASRIPYFAAHQPLAANELLSILSRADSEEAYLLVPAYLEEIRSGYVTPSAAEFNDMMKSLGMYIRGYSLSKCEAFQGYTIEVMHRSLDLWQASDSPSDVSLAERLMPLSRWIAYNLKKKFMRSWRLRDACARYFSKYLSVDTGELIYKESIRASEDVKEGTPNPKDLLLEMPVDPDTRVRLTISSILAEAVASQEEAQAITEYDQIRTNLPSHLEMLERMLTRSVTLGEIMVTKPSIRRGPYWHLLELSLHLPSVIPHIQAVLDAVAATLGLSLSGLFLLYAHQLAFTVGQAGRQIFEIPTRLLGYESEKALAEVAGVTLGSNLLVAWDEPQARAAFEVLCVLLERSADEVASLCFHNTVARTIAVKLTGEDSTLDHKASAWTERRLEHLPPSNIKADNLKEHIRARIDTITGVLVSSISDCDFSEEGSICASIWEATQSRPAVECFQALNKFRSAESIAMHEPNPPIFSADVVIRSLRILEPRAELSGADKLALTYRVIHGLYAEAARSQLVNEQMRLLQSLSVWISLNLEQFSSRTLLRTTMRGGCSMLQYQELLPQALSIVSWVLERYRVSEDPDPQVKGFLWTICKCAMVYRDSGFDVVSLKIFDWLAKEVQELAPIDSYRNDMEELAAMWPQPLALANAMDVDSVTSRVSQIFAILEKRQPTGHGIQLVRQLASIEWKPADWASWSYDAFGLLKACISESMKESDARAFAELLWRMGGNIEGKIYRTSEDLRLLHRRAAAKDRKKPHASGLLKPVLLIALFEMLFQDSYTQIDVAYTALQRALSLGLNGYSEDDLPRVHRSEAKMLLNKRVTVTFPSDSGKRIQDLASHGLRPELFETWICELTSIVASNLSSSDKFYVCLLPAIEGDPRFAEDILPLLIHETISNSSNAGDRHSISERLAISQCFRGVLRDVHAAQATVLSVLDIVKYLRHFPNRQDKSALGYNSWLDVDFVDLARAAIGCGSFTTALMFLEIAAEIKGDECLLAEQAIEELMYEIYTRIDDPDSFYGIRGRSIQQSLVRRFQHEHLWEKAHRFLGAQFEVDNLRASSTMGLVESLQSRGFDKQASVILDQAASRGVAVDYNLGWRTETWDLPPPPDGAGNGWNMYEALRAIHTSRNLADITHVVKAAVVREVLSLRLLSTENFAEVRRITRNIMCLRDINFWVEASISGEHLPLDSMAEVPLPKRLLDFDAQDALISTRISLFRSLRKHASSFSKEQSAYTQSISMEVAALTAVTKAARHAGELQKALNFITRAEELEKDQTFQVCKEFAKVLWELHEESLAIKQLAQLASSPPDSHSQPVGDQKPLLLARLGEWTAEARLQQPTDIRDQYFEKAVACIGEIGTSRSKNRKHARVYEKFALFAHRQYQAVMASPELIRLEVYIERKKNEIERLGGMRGPGISKQMKDSRALFEADSSQVQTQYDARDNFLVLAIEMYSRTLVSTDTADTECSIRLCSLWYKNFGRDEYGEPIHTAIARVPSHKFVFLAHQLTARLATTSMDSSRSQKTLWQLIRRICEEHPFHILLQLLALTRNEEKTSIGEASRSSPAIRQNAALELMSGLKVAGRTAEHIRDMERLTLACYKFASFPIKGMKDYESRTRKEFPVPTRQEIRTIQNLHVPVLTADTPIDISSRYDDIIYIQRFSDTFTTAGGVNMPKITECIGSNGSRYKQLFKGEGDDDLRQDAVMEQVFQLVNVLLDRDRETGRRRLRIRPYKVIPLAPKAGILEFVNNTTPLREWLTDAHARYRPRDTPHPEVGKRLSEARKFNPSKTSILAVYRELKKKFKPVMRHFFTEKHKDPAPWFASRINYSRSVAVTSIVGHLLGLGDRHASNILMDLVTGEVVHIDLGIAFEQGKILPIPETVPFRLTADMVDGFGITGTEGVFRRCAEHALRVLRENEEIILTVLEVFKYDPLHTWTANPVKMRQAQPGNAPTVNTEQSAINTALARLANTVGAVGIDIESSPAHESAHRALASVSRKLDKKLSIEYTVNELIVTARDEMNLANLFVGWGPYF